MLNCWQFNPHKRAQFPETVQKLDKILSMAVDQVDIFEEIVLRGDIYSEYIYSYLYIVKLDLILAFNA